MGARTGIRTYRSDTSSLTPTGTEISGPAVSGDSATLPGSPDDDPSEHLCDVQALVFENRLQIETEGKGMPDPRVSCQGEIVHAKATPASSFP